MRDLPNVRAEIDEEPRTAERRISALDQRLKLFGERRAAKWVDYLSATQELHRLVREAASTAGWSKTRIAKVAGISRQTVHEILKEER